VAQAAVVAREDTPGDKRLVGYVVAGAGAAAPNAAALRAWVAKSLPDYMVPAAFVTLDALPLTPTASSIGAHCLRLRSVRMLPNARRARRRRRFSAPCCRTAEAACGRIDDNFFELGGDSIMSIQLVSGRAKRLVITPRAVFQYQTVAALAAAAGAVAERSSSPPDIAVGVLPATPIIHWLIERGGPIEPFNQAMLLLVPAGLREQDLVAALQAVVDHYDALRLRLIAPAHGENCVLEILPAGAVGGEAFVRRIDIAELDACLQACLALSRRHKRHRDGLLPKRLGWCRRSGSMPARARPDDCCLPSITLQLTEFLGAFCCLILRRHGMRLRAGSGLCWRARTSFRHWANRLVEEAHSASRVGELAFWSGMLREPSLSLIAQALDPERDRYGSAGELTLTLPACPHGRAAHARAAAFFAGINDVAADRPGACGCDLGLPPWSGRRACGAD
jgi:hypothetical protein